MDVEKNIGKLLSASGLKIEQFLFEASISMDAYRKMVERGSLSKKAVENILDIFKVNRGFLEGSEEMKYEGKHTHGQIEPAVAGKHPKGDPEVYRTIVEGNTEYVLIPREVLKDTKLISSDQIANDRKLMDRLLEQNEKMIAKLLVSQQSELPGVKKGKNGA